MVRHTLMAAKTMPCTVDFLIARFVLCADYANSPARSYRSFYGVEAVLFSEITSSEFTLPLRFGTLTTPTSPSAIRNLSLGAPESAGQHHLPNTF